MPKIIFTSRYLRDAYPEQLENYVRLTIWCGQGLSQKNNAGGRTAGGTACFLR